MEALDDDFLSLVEAAEAAAKKRRLGSASSTGEREGSYTAALRGSRSLLWQQQASSDSADGRSKGRATDNFSAPGDFSGNACFKCGKPGHWARDCSVTGGADDGPKNPTVAEKPCPCGGGPCLILTANTEKNRGRKFYRCPVKEENGGCGFFEWCDNSSGVPVSRGVQNNPSSSVVSDLPCPCGAGVCVVLTAKTEKNMGQQFYRCPANQGVSCGFFKWCNEHSPVVGPPSSVKRVYSTSNDVSSQSSGGRSGSSCFKCGEDGHWARDCPKPSKDSYLDAGGRSGSGSGSSNACYKCGKAGHWARDCTSQELNVVTGSKKTSSFRSSRG